jgi:hypothetical protein
MADAAFMQEFSPVVKAGALQSVVTPVRTFVQNRSFTNNNYPHLTLLACKFRIA